MHSGVLRLSVCGLGLILMAGCGGSGGSSSGGGGNSGGGGSTNPTIVTVNFAGSAPTVAAVKVGTGSYSAQTVAGGKLTVTVPAGTTTYSVAYLCPPTQADGITAQTEGFQFGSTLDGTALNISCPQQTPALGTLTGTVDASAFPSAVAMNVLSMGSTYVGYMQSSPAGGAFQADGQTGSNRVLVGLYDATPNSLAANMLAVKNFDNQIVPGALNGGDPVVFAAADATTLQPVTYVNVPTGAGTPMLMARALNDSIPITAGKVAQYQQLPVGVLKSGEYYSILAYVGLGGNLTTVTAGAMAFPAAGGPVTLTFSSPWVTNGPAAAARPTFSFDYTGFAGRTNVRAVADAYWHANTSGFTISVTASGNYLAGTTSIQVPDLSGVSGFLPPPATGSIVVWDESISQSSFAPQASPAGGTLSYMLAQGSYNVP